MKSLILQSTDSEPQVVDKPVPQATPGSAVVQIYNAGVLAYADKLYSGQLKYPLCLPSTIGGSAIGRITDVGADATTLSPGQLVLTDSFICGRDNPSQQILFGIHAGFTPGARKLAEEEWRDSTYAEYAKVPLENVHVLNEEVLTKELGYTIEELCYMLRLSIPMGGLCALDIKAGETVIVAPATGAFGGATVEAAVAMGATVIAAARNKTMLEAISKVGGGDQVKTVVLTGDVDNDSQALSAFGEIDAYIDFSPPAASKSTHITSCLMAVKTGGRACWMGGIQETVPIPYSLIMFKSLKLMGKFMVSQSLLMGHSHMTRVFANACLGWYCSMSAKIYLE